MTTSSAASGASPSARVNGLSRSSTSQLAPIVMPRPLVSLAVPSACTSCAVPWIDPAAAATPSTAATRPTTVASRRARAEVNSPSTAAASRTMTSVPSLADSTTPSKVCSIVSVSTMVPAMKATPSTTARPVSA
jgi:hypothetical protein